MKSRRSRRRSKRKYVRKFKFGTTPSDYDALPPWLQNIIPQLIAKIPHGANYIAPIIISSILNMFLHPDTLSYVMIKNNYPPLPDYDTLFCLIGLKPTLEGGLKQVGAEIYTGINEEDINKILRVDKTVDISKMY